MYRPLRIEGLVHIIFILGILFLIGRERRYRRAIQSSSKLTRKVGRGNVILYRKWGSRPLKMKGAGVLYGG